MNAATGQLGLYSIGQNLVLTTCSLTPLPAARKPGKWNLYFVWPCAKTSVWKKEKRAIQEQLDVCQVLLCQLRSFPPNSLGAI